MSIKLMTWAFDRPELPPAEKLVLLILCDRANDDGECWPGQASIAKRASMSERTTRTKLQLLEDLGYIQRERRSTAEGRRTDKYTILHPDVVAQMQETTPVDSSNRQDLPVTPTGKSDRPNRQTVAGTKEPLVNPQLEKTRERARPIPDDWKPSEEHRHLANGNGLDRDAEAEQFRQHYRAHGTRAADWDLMFRRWLENPLTRKNAAARSRADGDALTLDIPKTKPPCSHDRRTVDGDCVRCSAPAWQLAAADGIAEGGMF